MRGRPQILTHRQKKQEKTAGSTRRHPSGAYASEEPRRRIRRITASESVEVIAVSQQQTREPAPMMDAGDPARDFLRIIATAVVTKSCLP